MKSCTLSCCVCFQSFHFGFVVLYCFCQGQYLPNNDWLNGCWVNRRLISDLNKISRNWWSLLKESRAWLMINCYWLQCTICNDGTMTVSAQNPACSLLFKPVKVKTQPVTAWFNQRQHKWGMRGVSRYNIKLLKRMYTYTWDIAFHTVIQAST